MSTVTIAPRACVVAIPEAPPLPHVPDAPPLPDWEPREPAPTPTREPNPFERPDWAKPGQEPAPKA